MFRKLPILTALTTFTLIAPFAFSDGQTQSIPHSLVTQSFSEVKETIDQEVLEHGADQVLLVFDIDNTTLSTEWDIASEHWYLWQSDLISKSEFGTGAVASNVPDLLTVQTWILQMTNMRLAEPRIASDVKELGQLGVRAFALTSRGLDMRDITLREFSRSQFDLASIAPGSKDGTASRYTPYDLKDPETYGITADDVTKFKLNTAKPVIYDHGIMFTSGQHKGVMLKTFLKKYSLGIKSVIFVDDRPHHLDGVRAALAGLPIDVTTVQYQHEKDRIASFHAGDKFEVIEQWCKLLPGLVTLQNGSRPVRTDSCPNVSN
jgi:hypothetical protein